jgi:hypothetical protein
MNATGTFLRSDPDDVQTERKDMGRVVVIGILYSGMSLHCNSAGRSIGQHFVISIIHFFARSENDYNGFQGIPSVSIGELKIKAPFSATVESIVRGTRGPLIDSATGKPVPGAQSTPYVLVYLREQNGQKICINKENPSTNDNAFFSALTEGHEYKFPDIVKDWERAHGASVESASGLGK